MRSENVGGYSGRRPHFPAFWTALTCEPACWASEVPTAREAGGNPGARRAEAKKRGGMGLREGRTQTSRPLIGDQGRPARIKPGRKAARPVRRHVGILSEAGSRPWESERFSCSWAKPAAGLAGGACDGCRTHGGSAPPKAARFSNTSRA